MSELTSNVTCSLEIYKRAGKLIPGWTQLISRRASQFANGISPIYAQRAKGSRFIDVDGNEYIDWVSAVSAIILGHADDVVDNAVKEQIDRGSLYSRNSPQEGTIPTARPVVRTFTRHLKCRGRRAGARVSVHHELCSIKIFQLSYAIRNTQ